MEYDKSAKFEKKKQEVLAKLKRHPKLIVEATQIFDETIRDFREYEREMVAKDELIVTDPLTGLFNKRYLKQGLAKEFARAKRFGHFVSLIMGDIDHFKEFNDTYGHQIGDVLLEKVGEIYLSVAREIDIPARYGGEEFALILPETDKPEYVAERIQEAVYGLNIHGTKLDHPLSISQGYATFPLDNKFSGIVKIDDGNDLLNQADKALYVAKRTGRNKICSMIDVYKSD